MITPIKPDSNIRQILTLPNESRSVELKPPMDWPIGKSAGKPALQNHHKAQEVIVAVLAMSNLRDGGKIIIGIQRNEDGVYVLEGVDDTMLNTYDPDTIYEQIRACGDPEPQFEVHNVLFEGKNFIVFSVQGFTSTPIACRNTKKLDKLESGAFYIRTFKPESKKAIHPTEMRSLVDLTVEKELENFTTRVQALINNGQLAVSNSGEQSSADDDASKFNSELEDLK